MNVAAKVCIGCETRVEIDPENPHVGPCVCGVHAWRAEPPTIAKTCKRCKVRIAVDPDHSHVEPCECGADEWHREFQPPPPPPAPPAHAIALPRPLSLLDFDDPETVALIEAMHDPEHVAAQPKCTCVLKCDPQGRILVHPPRIDCPIHEHQHPDSPNHRDRKPKTQTMPSPPLVAKEVP